MDLILGHDYLVEPGRVFRIQTGALRVETYYVDGQFVPASEAVIPVDDLAIMRGFGVFDLLRTLNGKPLFLKEHIKRLEDSARRLGIELPCPRRELINVVLETLHRNSFPESNIRVVVTGGSSPDFITPQGRPRLLVLVTRAPKLPHRWYTDGVKIITFLLERHMPGAKIIDYAPATIALRKAREKDAVEAVYVDRKANVREGTTSNLFALFNGTLVTPDKGILSGITRRAVLDLAVKRGPVDLRELSLNELLTADEVFITGTNKMIVPVNQVDDQVIGDGRPGRITRKLMKALRIRIDDYFENQKEEIYVGK